MSANQDIQGLRQQLDLILNYVPIVRFVNRVRKEMGLHHLVSMPEGARIDFGTTTCPISKAVPGQVRTGPTRITTTDQKLATAITKSLHGIFGTGFSIKFGTATGEFEIPLPEQVTNWITQHDEVWNEVVAREAEEQQAQQEAQQQYQSTLDKVFAEKMFVSDAITPKNLILTSF